MLIRRDEHNIDKAFRQALHDAQDTPPTHLWEGIRKQSSKRRRISAFWFVAALLVAAGAAFGGYRLLGEKKEFAATDNLILLEKQTEKKSSSEMKLNVLSTEKEEFTTPKADEATVTEKEKQKLREKYQKQTGSDQKSIESSAITTSDEELVTGSNNKELIRSSSPEASALVSPETGGGKPTVEEVVTQYSSSSDEEITAFDQSSYSENMTEESIATPEDTSYSINGADPEALNIPKSPASNRLSVGFYTSLFWPERDYVATGNNGVNAMLPNQQSDLSLRRPQLTAGYSIGIGTLYQVKPYIYLMSGLEIASFEEDTQWGDVYLSHDVIYEGYYNDTSYQYIDNDTLMSVTQVPNPVDSLTTVHSETRDQQNTYTSLQIPIIVGLSWQHKNWLLGAEGGVLLKVQKMFSGYYRTDDEIGSLQEDIGIPPLTASDPYPIEGKETSVKEYYTDWKMDYHIGLRAAYSFSEHWQASVGAQYRWMSFTSRSDHLDMHQLRMPGVSLGLFYKF